MILILLITNLSLQLRILPACLLPHTVCQYSELGPLNSEVILPHEGRKGSRPFIGSARCSFTVDLTLVAELSPCWLFQLLLFVLPGFLAGHSVSSGTRTLGFPLSVPFGSWRWAGSFTSHIPESSLLPSGHVWPLLALVNLVCLRCFLSCCLWFKTLKFAFSVLVRLVSWVWHSQAWLQLSQVTHWSVFETWVIYSVEQDCCCFYDCCPLFPSLAFWNCFPAPQPQAPSPSCLETQCWLIFFFYEWWLFS